MDDESYHTNNVGIYNRTKQSFSFAFYAGDMIRAWFCIGYQQWGVATGNGKTNSPTVVTLPISFTSSIYIANAGQGDLSYGDYGQAWVSVDQTTNSSIQIRWCYSAKAYWIVIGIQQWGIWNDNRSAGQIQCTFPVSNTKETLAILATYFDNTDVSNGAILIKGTTLSTCKIKLWSSTKISFWVIGYQSYNSISYCSPKSI